MTRSELITSMLKRYPHIGQEKAELLVNRILGEISHNLSLGNRIELRGFGAFSIRSRDPRTARNPKNGASVQVDRRHSIYFRAGKELRERMNLDASS
jgi:integration host factor subunit beta